MYICGPKHLATLPPGTLFGYYVQNSNGFQVGGINKLVAVVGDEFEYLTISSAFHDHKMDTGYGCYLRQKDTVKYYDHGSDYSIKQEIDFIPIMVEEEDELYAVFSKEDIADIIKELLNED